MIYDYLPGTLNAQNVFGPLFWIDHVNKTWTWLWTGNKNRSCPSLRGHKSSLKKLLLLRLQVFSTYVHAGIYFIPARVRVLWRIQSVLLIQCLNVKLMAKEQLVLDARLKSRINNTHLFLNHLLLINYEFEVKRCSFSTEKVLMIELFLENSLTTSWILQVSEP